ncbi:hypothetical protein [Brevundimonas naejangsanensis]|uniref:hypothetical protein n=1 Tax=Brevundimonas naejangsanensis TaxID=588932 RepID=UPI00320867D0
MFDVIALSLPAGHGFGDRTPVGAWGDPAGAACGIVTRHVETGELGVIAMRRRIDGVWTETARELGVGSLADAKGRLEVLLKIGAPPEPLPPNTAPRPALHDLKGRRPSAIFDSLRAPSHHLAAWALNQLYLALPKPDRNWAGDCQTKNFHTRLWEAQLLASFREQGLHVSQPFESPDFHIRNRLGGEAWVEAVTANPDQPYDHVNAPRVAPPKDREALFFGPAALRFAKTLGNKLQRRYDQMPHVQGKPFMLAVADFHASGSMLWSREGLAGYLYGQGAEVVVKNGQPVARPTHATHLHGPSRFPAGLFANADHAELSAVIFSNACAISKLSRVMVSAGGDPKGLRYTRIGKFFNRTEGALEGDDFCLDVTSDAYRGLWPQGYEPWSAELEVFHNPFARHPVPHALLPEATHWFDKDGEQVCSAFYETGILWSETWITDADKPPIRLEDILSGDIPAL